MTKVYALSTARAGSKSVINKNIMELMGKPLYLHNVLASMSCPEIIDTYITTDIPKVIELTSVYGYKVIHRPPELCLDSSTHDETILHGLMEIEKRIGEEVDVLVVMLGNTANVIKEDVEQALKILEEDSSADSVITVIKLNHFNPIRAYVKNSEKDYLTTYLDQDLIREKTERVDLSDKNSVGNIYFQNGLWFLRRKTIIDNDGILPFKWLGKRIRYIIQDPGLQEIDDNYQIKLFQ